MAYMVYFTMSYEKSREFRFENENFSFLRFSPFIPPPVVADFPNTEIKKTRSKQRPVIFSPYLIIV
jgi:hypothetical protein